MYWILIIMATCVLHSLSYWPPVYYILYHIGRLLTTFLVMLATCVLHSLSCWPPVCYIPYHVGRLLTTFLIMLATCLIHSLSCWLSAHYIPYICGRLRTSFFFLVAACLLHSFSWWPPADYCTLFILSVACWLHFLSCCPPVYPHSLSWWSPAIIPFLHAKTVVSCRANRRLGDINALGKRRLKADQFTGRWPFVKFRVLNFEYVCRCCWWINLWKMWWLFAKMQLLILWLKLLYLNKWRHSI